MASRASHLQIASYQHEAADATPNGPGKTGPSALVGDERARDPGGMFIYYFVIVDLPFEQVEPAVLQALPGLAGWADDAYRDGEHIRTRVGSEMVAKTVELTVAEPSRGAIETWIPIEWCATGAPSLFPRMQAEIVVAGIGPDTTQLALRGNYQPPLGRMGEALDRVLLHRIAESSVKRFVDHIAAATTEEVLHEAADRSAG